MPPVAMMAGESRTILPLLSRIATAQNTYWLVESGGLLIDIDVTDVSGGGSLDKLRVLDDDAGNFDTAIEFAGLGIVATGRYKFIIAPGVTGLSPASYTAFVQSLPPVNGKIQVVPTDANAIVYSVRIQCVKH
jgi:hypothetical protein